MSDRNKIYFLLKIAALQLSPQSMERLIQRFNQAAINLRRMGTASAMKPLRLYTSLLEEAVKPAIGTGKIPLMEEAKLTRFLKEVRRAPKPIPSDVEQILKRYFMYYG